MKALLASTSIVIGLVTAVLALLGSFGVSITGDQKDAIIGTVGALLAFAGIWFHPDLPPNKGT